MVCEKCKKQLSENAKFCTSCGEVIKKTKFCNKCGNELINNAKFCNKCGNNFTVKSDIPTLNSNNLSKKKIPIWIPFVGVGLVLLIVIVVIIFAGGNSYYFSNNNYEPQNEENPPIETGQSNKDPYTTAIDINSTYTYTNLDSDADVYELIKKDYDEQKKLCPSKIQALEETIMKKHNIKAVNLCEIDLDFAKELDKAIDFVYTEFPNAKDYLTVSIGHGNRNGGIAYFRPYLPFAFGEYAYSYPYGIKTIIVFNDYYFLNPEMFKKAIDDSSKSGHFPPNSRPDAVVVHEMGHYISFTALLNYYNYTYTPLFKGAGSSFIKVLEIWGEGSFSLKIIEEAYQNYKARTGSNISLTDFRAGISKYAMAKNDQGNYIYDETIAESFHDIYINGDNANPASKEIIQVLKKYL